MLRIDPGRRGWKRSVARLDPDFHQDDGIGSRYIRLSDRSRQRPNADFPLTSPTAFILNGNRT
jgi:hypothetical protein